MVYCCLYISDSCKYDFKYGSTLFFINLRFSHIKTNITKNIVINFVFLILVLEYYIYIKNMLFSDLLFYIIICFSSTLISFMLSTLFNSLDIVSFTLIIIMVSSYIEFFKKTDSFLTIVSIAIISGLISIPITQYCSQTNRFRTHLS